MPQKINRLKNEKDFEKITRSRLKEKEELLILKFAENNLNKIRFAVSVSKKISSKATTRNKLKRRLVNIISKKIPKIKKGTDFLIITLPGLEKKTFSEMEKITEKLFIKAKILTND